MKIAGFVKRFFPKFFVSLLKALSHSYRRRRVALKYFELPIRTLKEWSKKHTETSNFYYDITSINKVYLAHFIRSVTGTKIEDIKRYLAEIDEDVELRDYFLQELRRDASMRDTSAGLGRRIGWYALIRACKPKIVVETGVDAGLGACVIARALEKNALEGIVGRYFGTELDPDGGFLFSFRFKKFGEILYGDSIESLSQFPHEIDLFINDSNHDPKYEFSEYEEIRHKLSLNAIILSDNSHVSEKLAVFAEETGREFLFFSEKPADHWYTGAGIGAAFTRPKYEK